MRTAWRAPQANTDSGGRDGTTPGWSGWREALGVVSHRPHLIRTVSVALVVGTVLFAINQLDVVLRHHATTVTYLKVALTYVVPFVVSNYGLLVATHRPAPRKVATDGT